MHYAKQALTFEQQLELLQQRKLTVPDPARARRWLQNVSYYRLSAYFIPFKDGNDFRAGTRFDDIVSLYVFDRKLRLLVMDGIERIEVAVRTALTYQIAHVHGVFGHTDAANFQPHHFDHTRFMAELAAQEKRSRETFVAHFRAKYASDPHLPIWMATELMSLGTLSKLYGAARPEVTKPVAQSFAIPPQIMRSWLHSLTYVRNICAHHKRLWNRELAIKPKLPRRSRTWRHGALDNGRLYGVLMLLRHMMRVASPHSRWETRLVALLDEHPHVPPSAMGFPADWRLRA